MIVRVLPYHSGGKISVCPEYRPFGREGGDLRYQAAVIT